MMNRVVKFFGVTVASFIALLSVSAQTGAELGAARRFGIGPDSIACMRALSLYQSDYQNRNYDDAIVNWRKVWTNCPLALNNLTLHGATMYKFYIDRELNPVRKNALIDTLMLVWERGMVLRPQALETYQIQMMQDMLRYLDTPENQSRIIQKLEDVMATQKERTTALTYANYMRIIFAQHRDGMLSDEELIDNYNKINDALSEAINKTTDEKMAEELAKARDQFDEMFANSTAASCENLLKIYGEKFEDNKDDAEFLRKLTSMLNRKECTDSELFEKATEQQYALNPSPAAAYSMGMLFLGRNNLERAVEYFEDAIRNEANSFDKARYNYLLGGIMLSRFNRFTDAKKYAVEAIRLRPDWGEPYLLLATTYIAGPRCGADTFEQAYVYWVAVDKLQTARRVDPDIASRVDPLIRSYTQHFPRKEEAFMRNILEGSTVTVGCWIGESTRVRFP